MIDLRSTSEQAARPLTGAEVMTAETILEVGLGGNQASSDMLLICDAGIVSSLLADALRSRGHSNVFHLDGGYKS